MKLLRVLLVVLLALLLPMRGVMAAAMLCPPAAGHGPASVQHEVHANGAMSTHAAEVSHRHPHAAAHLHHDAGQGHERHDARGAHEASAGPDACNLCSACCSVPPVPSAVPGVLAPLALAAAAYPALSVPQPSFLAERQERPPRRC